jgi:type III pantothenate kinase
LSVYTIILMFLTIDIGNSKTKFGVFQSRQLIHRFSLPSVKTVSVEELLNQTESQFSGKITSVVISSVVTELQEVYQDFSEKLFKVSPLFVNHTLDFGFKINYHPPENLGIDRAVAAFAAREKYGSPCIVCGFGTATTIDAVNSQGEFIGGIITAGLGLLSDSLHQKTSKLPQVEIIKPEKVIGNSTVSAIQSGIYFGYLGLVEGIIQRISAEMQEKPHVIAHGGFSRLIADGTQIIEKLDETLILEGLMLIHEKVVSR